MRDQNLTCIGCPLGCSISVSLSDNGEVSEITGNTCKKGEEYARKEVTNPSRVVTSIVKINNGDVNMVPLIYLWKVHIPAVLGNDVFVHFSSLKVLRKYIFTSLIMLTPAGYNFIMQIYGNNLMDAYRI